MGVDIFGKNPRSKAGESFEANWTAWRELGGVCLRVAPGICSRIAAPDGPKAGDVWFSNDGFGLNDADAIALADALDHAITTDFIKYKAAVSEQEEQRHHAAMVEGHGADMVARLDAAADALEPASSDEPWLIRRLRDLNTQLTVQLASSRRARPRSETLARVEQQLLLPLFAARAAC